MKKKTLIILILILLLISFVGVMLFLNGNKKESSYTITFNSEGGTLVSSQVINEGSTVVKPEDPVKEGYEFIEWTVNGVTYDFSSEVTDDLELTAKYLKKDNDKITYTITFDSDGGNTIPNQIIEKGKSIVKPENPKKDGYIFEEWLLDDKTYDFNLVVDKDIKLTAKWKLDTTTQNSSNQTNNNEQTKNDNNQDEQKYTVTFNSNGGSTVKTQTVVKNKTASKPSNPTKSGYSFVEWQLNGKEYNFNTKVTKNITLKAVWVKTPIIETSYTKVGRDDDGIVYDIGLNANYYYIEEKDAWSVDGWELHESTDGKNYKLIYDEAPYVVPNVKIQFNNTKKYKARTYVKVNGKKIYSAWSSVIELNADVPATKIHYTNVGTESSGITYDIGLYAGNYYIEDEDDWSVDGWELYESTDGKDYKLIYDKEPYVVPNVKIQFNNTMKYKARTYIKVNGKKIYGAWSSVIELSAKLPAPKLNYEDLGIDGENHTYDFYIDYQTYRIDVLIEGNILNGWELYESTDGKNYTFAYDNSNESARPLESPSTSKKYKARVYVIINGKKVYSDWSNVKEINVN